MRMAPRKFSLECEVQDCGFRTPIVGEEPFAALVKLLQIHSMSVHDLPVGESPGHQARQPGPWGNSQSRQELGTCWEEAGEAQNTAPPPREEEGAATAAGSRVTSRESVGGISWLRQELAFSCTECESSYITMEGLKQHRRDKHSICPVLNTTSRSKSRKRQDLPFPCPDCGKYSYPTAQGLQVHRVQYCQDSQRWRGRRGRQ